VDTNLLHSPVPANLILSLCGEDGIKFKDRTFKPNKTRGYFQFSISKAFPATLLQHKTALHPAVISKSYETLADQNLNYEHQLAWNHPTRDVRDRVIGGIAAVDFPRVPSGGWKINPDISQAPSIDGVAVIYKQTAGSAQVWGEHMTGKRNYTLSMEVLWPFEEAGFAVGLAGRSSMNRDTPEDFLKAGYDYWSYDDAPAELRATFATKGPRKGEVVAQYRGRPVFVLMGGLDNPVDYTGIAVVKMGAEPTAKIMRLAASAQDPMALMADKIAKTFNTITENNRLLKSRSPSE
jgi:hypothetical protein